MATIPSSSTSLPSLLLLPPPPASLSTESITAAYRPTIEGTVSALKHLSKSTRLFITVPYLRPHDHVDQPRSHIYNNAQRLLAGIYGLFCVVCAKLDVDVDVDTPGAVDARILLLDYTRPESLSSYKAEVNPLASGPIIDFPTFALTRRKWFYIFSVDGEAGQQSLTSYFSLANQCSPPPEGHLYPVTGGISLHQGKAETFGKSINSSESHLVVAIGGTFDHIHVGHKLLLSAAALLLQPISISRRTKRRLIVGITGDDLLKEKKYAEYLKSWKQRQEDVIDFLLSVLLFVRGPTESSLEIESFNEPGPNGKAVHTTLKAVSITIECVEIQDPFGPTITDENVTALVVSGETRSGGKAVNEKRTEKGWNTLEVYEIDVLDSQETGDNPSKSENFASKISSTAIRKREADRGRTSSL